MSPALGDVVARARGLARHLLPEATLTTLAGARGSGALADALAQAGYPRASEESEGPLSAAERVEASIERETARRLSVIERWLGPRRRHFVAVFEDEERRALRVLLRRVAAGGTAARSRACADVLTTLSPRVRDELLRASDVAAFVRVLTRAGSPHAAPLAASLRAGESRLVDLEAALDRSFARRARAAARRLGGHLLAWVVEGVDLENAWAALLGGEAHFVEGGARLSRADFDAVVREPSESARRAALAGIFAGGPLGAVFADAGTPLARLEERSRRARRRALERTARRDPLGPAALLALLMRLREEAARLRRIAWAVAQGMPEAALAETRSGAVT